MIKLKKSYWILCLMLLMSQNAFASQPPKEFMKAILYAKDGDKVVNTERYGSMSDFIKCLKSRENSVKWEQSGKSWILHTKKKDSFTKEISKISWEFAYNNKAPEVLLLSRVLAGGVVYSNTISVMNNFESCWEQPTWDSKENIIKSIKQANETFKEQGMIGIRELVLACYQDANNRTPKSNIKMMSIERCLGFDLTGHVIDLGAQSSMNLPADPFFTKESLRERADSFLDYYSEEDVDKIIDQIIAFAMQK